MKSDIENTNIVNSVIKSKTLDVEADLMKYGKKYKQEDLNGLMDDVMANMKENSDALFTGDTNLENTYRSIMNDFRKEAMKHSQDDFGLWETRKIIDQRYKAKVKSAFQEDKTQTVKDAAIRDLRNAVNDFITKRATGAVYNEKMSSLTKLYRASDNMSNKFKTKQLSIISDKISTLGSAIKSHSAFSIVAGASIVTGGMLTPAIPIAAGLGIAGYGLYRGGRLAIQELKPAILKLLKYAEEQKLHSDVKILMSLQNDIKMLEAGKELPALTEGAMKMPGEVAIPSNTVELPFVINQ